MHHPTDRITHTTAFITPVVEHWPEREIALTVMFPIIMIMIMMMMMMMIIIIIIIITILFIYLFISLLWTTPLD